MERLKNKQPIQLNSSPFSGLVWTHSQTASASGVTDSDNNCPTDNPDDIAPRKCRLADNLGPQKGRLPPITLPQSPPPQINEGAAPQNAANKVGEIEMASCDSRSGLMTSDFGLLTVDYRLLTFMPLTTSIDAVMPTLYGENQCALARASWHGITREKKCA